jgi:hypothetical protein
MLLVAEQVWVKAAQVGLLPMALLPPPVKSSLGCAWLAARALPRHALQVGAWALVSELSYPSHCPLYLLLLPLPLLPGQVTCAILCSSTTALSSVCCLLRFLQCVLVLELLVTRVWLKFVSDNTLSVSTGSAVYVSEESKSLLVKDIVFLSNSLPVIL